MKIVYYNVIWFLMFVAYNYLCLAENEGNVITIGALFNEEDSQAKLPLQSAVETANRMQQLLHYEVEMLTIPRRDSFKSCKVLCNLTAQKDGVAGIFGPSSFMISPIIQSVCSNLEIPHIQINWRPQAKYDDVVVNFYPDPDLLSQGLAVIVKNLQWRSFTILYENDDGLIRLQDVLKLQDYSENNKFNTITVKQLGPGPDYRPLLKEVHNSSASKIILDCETEHILDILKQAKEVKLMEPLYNFFLTSLDAHTLDLSVLETKANITTIRIFNHTDKPDDHFEHALRNWKLYAEYHNPSLMDLDAHSVKTETVLIHDAVKMFMTVVNDLYYTEPIVTQPVKCDNEMDKWSHGIRITNYMKIKKNINGITGPIEFDNYGRRTNFTLYVFQGNRDNNVGTWTPEKPDSLKLLKNTSEYNISSVLSGRPLYISSRLGPPYLMEKKPLEGEVLRGNDRYEGYSIDLISEIANVMGFTFEFHLAEDGKYGNYDEEKKSWNGLIKDVLDHKADLAICDLTITHQRREVVDFSMPFMRLGISILYKKAEEKDVNMFAFLDPFSVDVWIYTATLYLAVSVILYFVSRMAPGDWENPHPCDENPTELENIWGIKNCLWLTLGSIMTQGCDILPKGISSRMASSMWWFFSLIMTSSYTANLAAFLTMERMEPSINSAEDLAKQTKIKYGALAGGATQAFFRESNYSTYQRMWTAMQQARPSVFEKNNADGVKRVQTTRQRMYAFLMESSQIEYEVETKCDLKQVGTWLDSKGYGIAMPVDYPYRSAINTAILKLQEEGKLNALKEKWWKKKRKEPSCEKAGSSEESSSELALANVGGVFLVLGIGVAIAFVLAILEFLWNIRNISVEEHITYWEALKVELLFALNIWVTKKRAKPQISESSSSHSGEDSKSIAHSILQGASSFLNLNVINRGTSVNNNDN